ncbi:DNA topoisomerase I [Macleaya cordata]|uniref:DNA topoisomerase I n=1 Tax=Macleaya cordata TaxID=56857 RepID=A0A200QVK8_MACCD|nr:DNA topoisomerase I [Macleaya cordata]
MAVDTCIKPKYHDDGEDDDEPMIFKRSKTTSKQNQLNSEIKKVSSQRPDGPSKRPTPDTSSPNCQSSSLQKGKVVSIAKTPASKSLIANSKASTSLADKSKQLPRQNSGINNIEKKPLNKPPIKPNADSEDSDDDKPLSARLTVATATSQKSNASNVVKGRSSSIPSSSMSEKARVDIKKSSEDSEDEIPLSSKFQLKSGAGSSVKKSYDSDEEKPLASKIQQNGSIKKENEPLKSPKVLNKRPLCDINTSVHSSVKKPKLSDASVSAKVKQVSVKAEPKKEDDDDDVPIAQRMKKSATSDSKSQSMKKTITKVVSSSMKKTSKKSKKVMKNSKYSKSTKLQPSSGEGQKWTTLEHNGVIFPPPYKPHGVKMLYNGQPIDLTPEQEEVATMFAVMKDTEYATKEKFIENFMNDWRVILGRNHVIKKFELCDFTPIYEWHQNEKEKKKQMSTEEKKTLKEEKLKQEEKYMWAVVDGVKEKVGNFRVEPPGLFRGRGEHPKMGKLKKRIRPSDITINIGKGAPIPECPIPGERWKEVKHDNTVTWLAFWNDPINPKEFKYVFLAASSSLKGQSDKEKYEKARLLKDYIHDIRANYTKDFVNKDLMKRQIAVATYLIDKLALRAGNEKDDDEADTVGCCTLKVENVELVAPNKLQFDFLGKDSIRYFNTVEVELPVYKAIGQFQTGKKDGEDLFDKLDTSKLNAHLKELMPGLTAKVFRTYNASITLDEMLNKETKDGDVAEKVVVYQHANKEVAIICNHQRSVSKSHTAQMSRLSEKMDELKALLDGLKTDLARAKKGKPPLKDADGKPKRNLAPEALERKINQTNAKIEKMERDMKTKEDLKTVALGTSKINYLDPRISVAWCKRHEVPIEKIFNKSLLAKFAWAMDVDPSFRF